MKKKTADAVAMASKAVEMSLAGFTIRSISEETGMSTGWVHKTIKKAQEAGTSGQGSDEPSEPLDNDDDSTSKPYLTTAQHRYIQERTQRIVLYNDTAEGWLISLSEAAIRAHGSVLWWAAIVYPESAPDGWENALDRTGMQWEKSLLHDKDPWDHDSPAGLGEENGKQKAFKKGEVYKIGDKKKSHWHILGKLDKPMKYAKLCKLVQSITHGTLPVEVTSLIGYHEYMGHVHNPDKYPYWKEGSPEAHNGFTLEMNGGERKRVQALIVSQINTYKIDTWGKLMKKYVACPEYLDIIAMRSAFYKNCVNHEYYKLHEVARQEYQVQLDIERNQALRDLTNKIDTMITGEVHNE